MKLVDYDWEMLGAILAYSLGGVLVCMAILSFWQAWNLM